MEMNNKLDELAADLDELLADLKKDTDNNDIENNANKTIANLLKSREQHKKMFDSAKKRLKKMSDDIEKE